MLDELIFLQIGQVILCDNQLVPYGNRLPIGTALRQGDAVGLFG